MYSENSVSDIFFTRISASKSHMSEKERLNQESLDIKCLVLLRAMIYNEIVKLPNEWESHASSKAVVK